MVPPPPTMASDTAMDGSFTMAMSEDLLGAQSSFVSHRSRETARSEILPNGRALTLPPGELELSDSDRPTEISYPPASAILGFDREFPTIPAPLWGEAESAVRPAPAVATSRGIFLENLVIESDAPPSLDHLTLAPLDDAIDFDSDESL